MKYLTILSFNEILNYLSRISITKVLSISLFKLILICELNNVTEVWNADESKRVDHFKILFLVMKYGRSLHVMLVVSHSYWTDMMMMQSLCHATPAMHQLGY